MNKQPMIKGFEKLFYQLLTTVDGTEDLIKHLNTVDFFKYPASLKHHGAFRGGLVTHSINVYNLFNHKCDLYNVKINQRTIIISSLLHDVCKTQEYTLDNATGRFVWNKKPFDNTHGTKSIKIIEKSFKLTKLEKALIKYHMGMYQTELFKHPKEYSFQEYVKITNKHPIIMMFHNCDDEVSKFIC